MKFLDEKKTSVNKKQTTPSFTFFLHVRNADSVCSGVKENRKRYNNLTGN